MASCQCPVFFTRKNTLLMVMVSSLLLACLSISFNLLLTLSTYSLFTHWPAIPNDLQVLLLLVCFTLSGLCSVFCLFSLSPVLSSSQGCIPVVNTIWPRQLAHICVSRFSRALLSSSACTFGALYVILFCQVIKM